MTIPSAGQHLARSRAGAAAALEPAPEQGCSGWSRPGCPAAAARPRLSHPLHMRQAVKKPGPTHEVGGSGASTAGVRCQPLRAAGSTAQVHSFRLRPGGKQTGAEQGLSTLPACPPGSRISARAPADGPLRWEAWPAAGVLLLLGPQPEPAQSAFCAAAEVEGPGSTQLATCPGHTLFECIQTRNDLLDMDQSRFPSLGSFQGTGGFAARLPLSLVQSAASVEPKTRLSCRPLGVSAEMLGLPAEACRCGRPHYILWHQRLVLVWTQSPPADRAAHGEKTHACRRSAQLPGKGAAKALGCGSLQPAPQTDQATSWPAKKLKVTSFSAIAAKISAQIVGLPASELAPEDLPRTAGQPWWEGGLAGKASCWPPARAAQPAWQLPGCPEQSPVQPGWSHRLNYIFPCVFWYNLQYVQNGLRCSQGALQECQRLELMQVGASHDRGLGK